MVKFYANWKNLQELMQSEGSRTRRTLYTEMDTLRLNVMDFSTSSCNAKTQNNAEGLLKKRAATHIQRKNCGSRNTDEKQLSELMDGWGYYWGYRDKQPT